MSSLFNKTFYNFEDPILEKRFHENYQSVLKKMILFSVIVFLLNVASLLYSDLYLTSDAAPFGYLAKFRVAMILYMLLILPAIKKTSDFSIIEKHILMLFIFLSVANFAGHYSNLNPENNVYTVELMVVLAFYLIFPINLRYQVIGALLFTFSSVYSLDSDLHTVKTFSHTIGMFVNCNVVGFFISRYDHKIMRKMFMTYMKESEVKMALEGVTSELKHISGVVPICNTCFSVRKDNGYWDQLEKYVTDNSNAQFTHSICPDCTKRMFEELEDEEEQN